MFGAKQVTVPGATPKERAQWLISNGWYQTSRKYRALCRLPEGKTGVEALTEASMDMRPWDAEKWATALGEGSAGDHFLRCCAMQTDGLSVEVDQATFNAYRELGGDTYQSAYYRRARELKEATRVALKVGQVGASARTVVELAKHFPEGTKIEDVKIEVAAEMEAAEGGEPYTLVTIECAPARYPHC